MGFDSRQSGCNLYRSIVLVEKWGDPWCIQAVGPLTLVLEVMSQDDSGRYTFGYGWVRYLQIQTVWVTLKLATSGIISRYLFPWFFFQWIPVSQATVEMSPLFVHQPHDPQTNSFGFAKFWTNPLMVIRNVISLPWLAMKPPEFSFKLTNEVEQQKFFILAKYNLNLWLELAA